jgi:hypothetical protein
MNTQQPEAEPPETPSFYRSPEKLINTFNSNLEQLKTVLENANNLEAIVDGLLDEHGSPFYESLQRALRIMRFADRTRRFTLKPLVAQYNEGSEDHHQLFAILTQEENEINHIFVNPISALDNVYYHYLLYIPVPKDIIRSSDTKTLIEDHWNLLFEDEPSKFEKKGVLKEFRPIYTIGRVYGWDGSWLAYSVTVLDKEDKKDFWSLPLVDTPYNGSQPFVSVPEGEFAILEHDETETSVNSSNAALYKIKKRVDERIGVDFKECTIKVLPEIIAAYSGLNPEDISEVNWKNSSHELGSKIPSIGISDPDKIAFELSDSPKVLEYLKKNIMGKPLVTFTPKEIGKHKILNRL